MSKNFPATATGDIAATSAFDVVRDGPARQGVLNWIANGQISTLSNFVTAQVVGAITLNNAVRSLLGANSFLATVTITFSDGSRSSFRIQPDRIEYIDDSSYDFTNNRIPEDTSDADEFIHDYSGGGGGGVGGGAYDEAAARMRQHLQSIGYSIGWGFEKWVCIGTTSGVVCTQLPT